MAFRSLDYRDGRVPLDRLVGGLSQGVWSVKMTPSKESHRSLLLELHMTKAVPARLRWASLLLRSSQVPPHGPVLCTKDAFFSAHRTCYTVLPRPAWKHLIAR